VVHPLNSAGKFDDVAPDSAFVIRGSYVESHRYEDTIERDGLTMTFHSVHRSMETYLGALADAGFVLEALREPTPDPEHVAAEPAAARWQRVPLPPPTGGEAGIALPPPGVANICSGIPWG